jgi:hypothetical protein
MKKLGGIFLALLTFFSSTLNVFADTIEVIEEKTQTINKDDYESLKNDVEKKVFDLNEQDDEYVYDYEISITEEKEEVVVTDTKKVTSEKKFTSEEEARKYYEEYELEDSWKQGELTITSNKEDVVVNGDEITITCKEETCTEEIAALENALNEYEKIEVISKNTTSKDDEKVIVYAIDGKEQELHYEDALKLVATLNPEIEGYTLVKNEYILVKKGSIDAKTFKEIVGTDKYETYAEAKSAADKFLSDENYEDKVAVIVAVYDESEKEKITTELGGYLTEELAYAGALDDAKKELEKAIEEGKITIEGTIEEAKKALETAYQTGKLQLNGIELDGRIVYYYLPEKRTVESVEELNQTFFTKTAAELAKAALEETAKELEGTGVSIEEITLTETNEEAWNSSTPVKQTAIRGKYYLVPVATSEGFTYYSIRNGNKLVIWTVDPLTAEQKEELTKSLKENDENLSLVQYINGYNTFDLSELGSDWTSSYKFTSGRFSKTLEVNSASTNEVVQMGTVVKGKIYKLTAKTVTKTELWFVDKTEIKYGFDYTVQGGGATITRDLFKVQSILAGKIYNHTMAYRVNTTESYTSYIASFDVYKEETRTNATVSYKITKEKAATGTVIPDEEETITPPNTGAEVSFAFQGLVLIALLASALSLKKQCK